MFQPAGSPHIVGGKFAHGVADVVRDRLVGEPLASRRLGPLAFGFCHVGSGDNPPAQVKVRSASRNIVAGTGAVYLELRAVARRSPLRCLRAVLTQPCGDNLDQGI
jgi:hypothetical protein